MGSYKYDIRLIAAEILTDIEKNDIYEGEILGNVLYQKQFLSKQDRAFLTRLVEGVTEYRIRLDYIIDKFSKKPVSKCKPMIRTLLRMGVYQMLYMDSVPASAACHESVRIAKEKGFVTLSGFVNGILRNISRNLDSIEFPKKEDNIVIYLSVEYSAPTFVAEKLVEWYGEDVAETVLKSSLRTPKLTIRINPDKTDEKQFLTELEKQEISYTKGAYVPYAYSLENVNYVEWIPGYNEGSFFVQDESSMLVYEMSKMYEKLPGNEGQKPLNIIDVCAAPGGKTTHFADFLGPEAKILSRDVSEAKTSLIKENLKRLKLDNVEVEEYDSSVYDVSLKRTADLVIADIPCSGLGVLGRKNDIKYHVSQKEFDELKIIQRAILTQASRYVRRGGLLIFSTCTINPDENMGNVKWITDNYDYEPVDIREVVPENLQDAVKGDDNNMLLLLPGIHDCDGFFISVLRRF